MMDFSKFLDANFDVKDWVNAAFKAQKDSPEQKDAHAATLVMKLQLFIQEVNNSLEETSQQALQNLPRVLRDVEAVRQEAGFLKDQMQLVKEDIKKVEEDTSESMKMLLEIDTIKSRMKAASDALQEADNWTTLMADVDEVFASKDVQLIADKLLAMQHSLSMLAHCGDYDERCQSLEVLKNRLEALLSPQLVSAFNSHSLEAAQRYVKIFKDMDRLSQLRNYYYKCHKSSLLLQWQQLQETNREKVLAEWLPSFYETLLTTWHREVQWCDQVFPDAVPMVCELLAQTLSCLQPSLPACMDSALQDNALLNLIDLRQITLRFIKSLEGAIQSVTDTLVGSHFEDLVHAIHAPYIPYLIRYGFYEEEHLVQELSTINMERQDLIDCAQLLSDSLNKIFKLTNEASDRCTAFTGGFGMAGLLSALKATFSSYCQKFDRSLETLRSACGLDPVSTNAMVMTSAGAELGEDWSKFQNALKIVQTCGELLLQSEEFELQLSSSLLHTCSSYDIQVFSPTSPTKPSASHSSSFKEYNYLAREDPAQHAAFQELILKLREDDGSSLLQEPLEAMSKITEHAHKLAFGIVFFQLQLQLSQVSQMEVWTDEGGMLSADLPTFSLSPQEYITKIGQYLMTLPQQLETCTSQDNPAMEKALEASQLPFPPSPGSPEVAHLADYWIGSVARATMHMYVEVILRINELTQQAARQLSTDIDYLCNVVDALGIHPSPNLKHIEELLKMPLSQYGEVKGVIPDRLMHAVASMRSGAES
ncbi:conserved oligomeric Golgi complex subunit 7 [Strongylocentrotus purpuratus]|uniref:Conserved oligomeric Golgi complex subunit 7 n=1 Tax=Strongylocentrotus purpuratus TaxID=7668 RepID=A0A7M7NP09_STRPU|nr:conserved oligomeric Golgi complex subunit 7 [Strongylocentrotus purpuratus]|eukprot:XP_786237.3 PREDICTED: conserved oligomeric Golgi complex subunit 7 isoform X1 [Strongylocentrotus purpuratus]